MEFRQDINALRALAVIAVTCYHFGLAGFTGGFVGVDVFFVISGFLMTGIIFSAIEAHKFSLTGFYLARAVRIVPALAVLCAVLLALGWFWLPPYDYAATAKHAASALGFISNFVFYDEAGYFDSFSKDKWLLHTWSLSVEWQFYVLFPVFVWGIFKYAPRHAAKIFLAAAGVSLFTCIALTPSQATFAFFQLPLRMWELLAGALAFIFTRRYAARFEHLHQSAHIAGLALIALSIFIFDPNTPWPGHAALLPVIGTFLIVAMPAASRRVYAARPIQAIGAWSYSIYLWHWPVYVALRQMERDQQPSGIAIGIALSVLLGFISYKAVETPVRQYRKNKLVMAGFAAFFTLALAGALWVQHAQGFPNRAPQAVRDIESVIEATKNSKTFPCDTGNSLARSYADYPECGQDHLPAYAILGDSHAGAIFSGLYDMALPHKGVIYGKSCPSVMGGYVDSKSRKNDCPDFMNAVISELDALPADIPLLVMSRLSFYLHGYNEHPDKKLVLRYLDIPDAETDADPAGVYARKLKDTLCRLRQNGRPVFVMRPIPEIGIEVPRTLTRRMMLRHQSRDITIPMDEYTARHEAVQNALDAAAETCGIVTLDPVPLLCKNGQCKGSENGVPLYADDDHLSDAGTQKLAPALTPFLEAMRR